MYRTPLQNWRSMKLIRGSNIFLSELHGIVALLPGKSVVKWVKLWRPPCQYLMQVYRWPMQLILWRVVESDILVLHVVVTLLHRKMVAMWVLDWSC